MGIGNIKIKKHPEHISIVMDGNGRWAKRKGLPRVAGHRAGVDALRMLIKHMVKLNINSVTVYAFSRENWQRPKKEVSLLMDLFMTSIRSEVETLHNNNIRLLFIGDFLAFSEKLQKSIKDSQQLTALNTGLRLNIAVNYSGRWDIVEACRKIISNDKDTIINEEMINKHLSLSAMSDPDLFIRTGGEYRISNYFLWQLAYTELYFTDTLWPDFDHEKFNLALEWFSQRERRLGKTSEQLKQL